MKNKYLQFIVAVSVNLYGKIGMILATSSFITFFILEIPRLLGIFTNAYIGLISYLLLPTLFVIGLMLIPFGWWKYKRETGIPLAELTETRFPKGDLQDSKFGSGLFRTIAILTLLNILFLSFASFRTLKFMDGAEFCGTACHSVMNPEWVTYQDSPHAHVDCVSCHVGEGVDALIASKLNGAWQMISLTFDLYERPIPTPVHNLRPARETCEKCHWPDKFYGSKLKTLVRYKNDEKNTPQYTTLNLKIDTRTNSGKGGIHWHISKNNVVRYQSVTEKREEMLWVENILPDGTVRKFTNKNVVSTESEEENIREMDCVDCHNRATHIYEDPENAIDSRIEKNQIDKNLPFIKREASYVIQKTYASKEKAEVLIDNYISRFYRKNYPNIANSKSEEIGKTISTLQKVYNKNIHPNMKIEWDSYPNHLGHKHDGGCFRCHNQNMVDEKGVAIRSDCTLCHSILAYDSDEAFKYLQPVNSKEKDAQMHIDLQKEFLNSNKK